MFTLISYQLSTSTSLIVLHSVYMAFESSIILVKLSRDSRVSKVQVEQFETIEAARAKQKELRQNEAQLVR